MPGYKKILASRAVGKGVYLFVVREGIERFVIEAMNYKTSATIIMVEAKTESDIRPVWEVYRTFRPEIIGLLLSYAVHEEPITVYGDYRLT